MRKNKLTALTMAATMMATAFVGTMTANAEDKVVDFNDVVTGIDLVYNETKSTATERYVDVYINGITDVGQLSFKFEVEKKSKTEGIIVDSAANASDLFVNYDDTLSNGTANNKLQRNNNLAYDLYNGAFKAPDAYTLFGGGYFGTMKFEVSSAEDTFYVKVMSNSSVSAYVDNTLKKIPASNLDELVVPKFSSVKTVATTDLGTFDAYADEAVSAYTATIDSADAAKTINWVFSNAAGDTFKKAAKIGDEAVVSGEATIVLGLKVMGGIPAEVASVTLTVE